jgi:hypothetical protein
MKYKIGKSKIEGAGKGLIVKKPFRAGEMIGLAHVDDQPVTSIGKFHNHSEEPTAGSIKIDNRRYIVAMRDLEPGDEITTDYRQQPELEQPEDFKKGGAIKLPKMPKPSKKGVLGKGYSRSLDATNRLFTENNLFEKPKSRKRKVFDPGANYAEGGEPCAQGLRKDEFGNCIPITTNKEVVVKTPQANPITKKLNYLRKKLEKYDSQNDGLGPTKMSDMSERSKIYKRIVELEAKHKDKLKNTPRIDQMEAVGNTMLTVGKYFMPGVVKTGINYLLNASDAYDYTQDPNNESNKISVASDMLSPLKSAKTKVAPFSVMSDVINLKQQYDKFEGAKKKRYEEGGSLPKAEYGMPMGTGASQNYQGRRKFIYEEGGYIETELTDDEIEEYRRGGWIVEEY